MKKTNVTERNGKPPGETDQPRTTKPTTPKWGTSRARIVDCASRISATQTRLESDHGSAESSPLVRAEVIAKALDVNKRTVCLWAQNGTIPCIRIGGIVRFDMEAIRAFIEGRNE